MLHEQTREPIRLHWKNEYEDRTSQTTNGDSTIIQENSQATATENGGGRSHATDKEALLEELGGTVEDTEHEEVADVQGNKSEGNTADSLSNFMAHQKVRVLTRPRKPPLKLSKDFL
jgi:hypothetical protein